MKLFKKSIIPTLSFIILFIVSAVPASAGGFSIGYSSGGHQSHHYNHKRHSSAKYYSYNYGHSRSYYSKHYARPSYQSNIQHNYSNRSTYSKSCHPVSKTIINEYSEYQKISGTMCYNTYGQAYIVPGSRFRLR